MKRSRLALIMLISLAGVALVGLVIAAAANHYLTSSEASTSCQSTGTHHYVTIVNSQVMPVQTEAQRCDMLTITNDDQQQRLLAFGPHDHHISYDGVSERLLSQGQSLTITLTKTGSYTFHDHENDTQIHGSFTVR